MGKHIVILPDVRLAFFDGYVARPNKNGKDPKFGANAIFDKGSVAYQRAEAAFLQAAQEEYGQNWQAFLGAMEASKKCLRTGDRNINAQTGEIRDGFAGKMYVVAKNKARPAIVAHRFYQGEHVHIAEDGSAWVKGRKIEPAELGFEVKKPYGGCQVNMKVEISAMKAKGEISACVFAKLLAVQFLRDGTAFGSGPSTADGFEDTGGDEGESAFGGASAPAADAGNLFG